MSAWQFDPPPAQPGLAGSGAKVSQPAPPQPTHSLIVTKQQDVVIRVGGPSPGGEVVRLRIVHEGQILSVYDASDNRVHWQTTRPL